MKCSSKKGRVVFGNNTIGYSILRSIRRRKTITLSVEPSGNLLVRAPVRATDAKLAHIVKSKSEWFIKKLNSLNDVSCPARKEFVSGESFTYLGRHVRLKILRDTGNKKPSVRMSGNRLQLFFYRSNRKGKYSNEIRDAITEWYRSQARKRVNERVRIYAKKMGLSDPKVLIRNQQKRWGSCNKKGELRFNWRIIMAPMSLIDYIIVHELCHIKYKNHSKLFWKYLGAIMPDYEKKKERIRIDGVHWHI